jgi:hypothetical protein
LEQVLNSHSTVSFPRQYRYFSQPGIAQGAPISKLTTEFPGCLGSISFTKHRTLDKSLEKGENIRNNRLNQVLVSGHEIGGIRGGQFRSQAAFLLKERYNS